MRPVAEQEEKIGEAHAAHESSARSRPLTVTLVAGRAAEIAVVAAPALADQHGSSRRPNPRFPRAANGCRTIVGQYQRGRACQSPPPAANGQDRAREDAAARRGGAAPPAHGATVAYIVERLREDILAGRVAPGQRLVECDLTARFAVSRGPVREALRRLAADGLIDHWPNRGALVRRLSAREIGEFFQIRVELESLAARLAAESDDTAARARFAAAIEPILADEPRRLPDYLCENAAFHEALMALAGNRQLSELALRLHLPLIMAQVADILTPMCSKRQSASTARSPPRSSSETQKRRRTSCARILAALARSRSSGPTTSRS